MTLLSFVLMFNVFIFNGQHFLQLIGTAMGMSVALTFACIFIGWVKTIILPTWMGTNLNLWEIYIDEKFSLLWNSRRTVKVFWTLQLLPWNNQVYFWLQFQDKISGLPGHAHLDRPWSKQTSSRRIERSASSCCQAVHIQAIVATPSPINIDWDISAAWW